MKIAYFSSFLIACFVLFQDAGLFAQNWKFIKEKEGIRIYTREDPSSPIKSFKGEMTCKTTMKQVSTLIGNPHNFSWWADDITVKLLDYEENKFMRYYVIYDVPWPLSDRDLAVEAKITTDPKTGTRTVYATVLPNVVPVNKDNIRITNYWQKWTATPIENGMVHLVLEGSVDPGGAIPSWLYNMVITETPLKVMREVKKRIVSQ